MFSHESFPLITLFIILLGGLVAFLHPVHALISWLRRRKERSSAHAAKEINSR